MKALIFNSGIGKRMGEMTKNSPKSMVKLLNNETIFERQIRILSECGIKEFVVTTGPFEDQLIAVTKKKAYKDLKFTFVHNDKFDTTNYIYSCYLARNYLDDDFLTLHGDLVFNKNLVLAMLKDPRKSLGLINKSIPLPEKDFKGRVIDNKLREVGINIFDENCFTFQPLYKLSQKDAKIWVENIVSFIEERDIKTVYAENAMNEISDKMNIEIFEYNDYYINEIDNLDDYKKVTKDIENIDYKEQEILYGLDALDDVIKAYKIKHPLVVIDKFLIGTWATKKIESLLDPVYFNGFTPNPLYEQVIDGLNAFNSNDCDSIIAIGGGSCIDVAKAIKLFLPLDKNINYLEQEHKYLNLKLIAIPTTAGTGSESTRYAVIYYNDVKQSLTDDMIVPDVAILEKEFLKSLPLKQRKATIFDALCHSVESIWSINATNDSRNYASKAIGLILKNIDAYLNELDTNYNEIVEAANLAGKAINISQTTAAHALSYKVTSLYKVPHGQAVAICLPKLWEILYKSNEHQEIMTFIDSLFNEKQAYKYFASLLTKYDMYIDADINKDLDILINSVNLTRLRNFPYSLSAEDIKNTYLSIIKK